MIKHLKYLILAVVLLFSVCSPALADNTAQTLRVGIYFGSSALEKAELKASGGFYMGYSGGRSFTAVYPTDFAEISVVQNTAALLGGAASDGGAFHVVYFACSQPSEISAHLETLNANKIEGFAAYANSGIYVLGGSFKSQNDALWAAENLPVKGSVYHASAQSLRAVSPSSGKTVFMFDDSQSALEICAKDYQNADSTVGIAGANSGTYRGGIELKSSGSAISAVNIVPLEGYLYGVISREMSPSWHIEALKAQTVCARTFAYSRINYHSKYGFDVCSSTCCQAYSGTEREDANVYNAVNGTNGEVMTYGGKPIQAVYSSSMGSSTESAEYVWGSAVPYLVSVENPYEKTAEIYNGKWEKTLTLARATEIMNAKNYNIGTVTAVEALEYSPAGRVIKLRVKGTDGEKIFEREACRSIFSEATLSQKYTVSAGGTTTYPSLTVTNGSATNQKPLNTLFVMSGSGAAAQAASEVFVSDGKTTKSYAASAAAGDANTLVFSGEGWGHGVGLSQYGAKGMAEAGFDYRSILTHFYTGVNIERL